MTMTNQLWSMKIILPQYQVMTTQPKQPKPHEDLLESQSQYNNMNHP